MEPSELRLLVIDRDPERGGLLAAAFAAAATPEAGSATGGAGARVQVELADDPQRTPRAGGATFDAIVLRLGARESPCAPLESLATLGATRPLVLLGGDASRAGVQRFLARRVALHVPLPDDADELRLAAAARWVSWSLERRRLEAELARAHQENLHLAAHDPLTGLANRELFRERIDALIARGERHGRRFALLILDLDRFRDVNDTLGPSVGDAVLIETARRIAGCLGAEDSAARRGGDEFTVLLGDVRQVDDPAAAARKLCEALAEPFDVRERRIRCAASIGVSRYPDDGRDADTLVQHADVAMYRAKEAGRDGFRLYAPEMGARALERLELESALRRGLERDELVLHYQPVVELDTGRIVSFEALARWQHPELGLVYPDQFIQLAEETGQIGELGEQVLDRACRDAVLWRADGLRPVAVGVNVSARQFQRGDLVERVASALERTGLEPRRLDLELTESAVIHDPDHAEEVLAHLRALGVRITIDDFGTGYSSLGHLKRFPLDRLKIDKSFVRTLRIDPKDAAITRAVVGMAHSLGLRAVAEGVETVGQLAYLQSPGCDEVQGFLFSPPVPEPEARELLRRERFASYAERSLV